MNTTVLLSHLKFSSSSSSLLTRKKTYFEFAHQVNFAFQFLRQKFVIFSQFLFDDHIKSRLYRDIKFFKENREGLNNRYPYDRAHKFNKEIRKLGTVNQTMTYLDSFRTLITEIGNAMGYVRMVRSGGFNNVSNGIKFVPDLENILPFDELTPKDKVSSETVEAARFLMNFFSFFDFFPFFLLFIQLKILVFLLLMLEILTM
jgi:hypothetical protein